MHPSPPHPEPSGLTSLSSYGNQCSILRFKVVVAVWSKPASGAAMDPERIPVENLQGYPKGQLPPGIWCRLSWLIGGIYNYHKGE